MATTCAVNGFHITPCDMLGRALAYGNPTGRNKGVFLPARVDIKTGERGVDIVQIHSGDFVYSGAAAYYCPFCGTRIATWENE